MGLFELFAGALGNEKLVVGMGGTAGVNLEIASLPRTSEKVSTKEVWQAKIDFGMRKDKISPGMIPATLTNSESPSSQVSAVHYRSRTFKHEKE